MRSACSAYPNLLEFIVHRNNFDDEWRVLIKVNVCVERNESIRPTERLAMLPLCPAFQSHTAVFVTCVMATGFDRDGLYRISNPQGTVCTRIITAYCKMLTRTA